MCVFNIMQYNDTAANMQQKQETERDTLHVPEINYNSQYEKHLTRWTFVWTITVMLHEQNQRHLEKERVLPSWREAAMLLLLSNSICSLNKQLEV